MNYKHRETKEKELNKTGRIISPPRACVIEEHVFHEIRFIVKAES